VWSNDPYTYVFTANRHDATNKTIFGIMKNWDGPEVIDAIFTIPAKRDATARRIVTKLWTYFAHPDPPANVVNELATSFATGPTPFEIKPLLRALFLRPEFYSIKAKQGLVRSPVEFMAAAMASCKMTAAELHPEWYGAEFGQRLLAPPNVAGWQNNAYWVNTAGMKMRGDLATSVHWKLNDLQRHPLADIANLTAPQVVTLLLTFLDLTVSSQTRTVMENFIVNTRAAHRNWNASSLITLALLSPEFNLA
jgi:uncharacterized protein (DUF1800 family)